MSRTSYGHWGFGEASLAAYVACSLGNYREYGMQYDLDGLVTAYRAAINEQFDEAGDGLLLVGSEFEGPAPRPENVGELLTAAFEAVDFQRLAARFEVHN